MISSKNTSWAWAGRQALQLTPGTLCGESAACRWRLPSPLPVLPPASPASCSVHTIHHTTPGSHALGLAHRYRRFVDANQHLTQIDWLWLSLGMWPPQGDGCNL